ncbi:MAG: NUDIX domain-containing protein [Clostridia bacterium]|nr:NUDIX domain-containing protein [Clostridia bacterium]
MDLTLLTTEGKLNIRVAAVILNEGKILVEQGLRANYSVCPGGRVKFGETAEQAIERELTEELGEKPCVIRPLYVYQNFFDIDGYKCHELCFFFLVEVVQSICEKQSMNNLNGTSSFRWVDVAELPNMMFYPTVLKQSVNNLPKHLTMITEYKEGFLYGIGKRNDE